MPDEELNRLLLYRIEDLRKRLLNLSTNNKLLSTKFSQRTRSHVRVIDELPDILFEKLNDGSMTFRSLPPLEEVLADEKTEEFKNAVDNARLTDEDYQLALLELEEQGKEEDSEEFNELDRHLKDKVREQLGIPPRQAGTSGDI